MANLVETFKTFNRNQRRPNRTRHLELCGFRLTRRVHPEDGKPSEQAMEYLDALSHVNKCFYHAVTLAKKDYDGWTYYEVWTKQIQ